MTIQAKSNHFYLWFLSCKWNKIILENYCELKQLDPSILSILEKILGRYADEVNSKGVCNEIETRSYFNVVRSISSMTKGEFDEVRIFILFLCTLS